MTRADERDQRSSADGAQGPHDLDPTVTGDLDEVLAGALEHARPYAEEGTLPTRAPSVAEVDPTRFGIAAVELDGTEHVAGEADTPFPIQSISKVFSLVLAMQKAEDGRGIEAELWQRVGVEPSGDPFNSLVQLEHEEGVPRNPMINAGALIVDDVLVTHCEDPPGDMRSLVSELAGEPLDLDGTVLEQDGESGHRNRAMAYLMSSFGNLRNPIDRVLDTYVHQCAVSMTTRQLARAVRFLANHGVDPATGRQVLEPASARRVAAIMLTCGTYDAAGEFAFNVGLPCKSGVAGGIVGTVTDTMGVCVWSPPLAPSGNSAGGTAALAYLAERLRISLF
ncbi:glutaminase [Egibacter rhizosphaerae]|uniref:Glutaminase n=1 Tax=Egibacter rhizosphaerae TaxID=1670831 RepID=A0A411YE01_9ACTN|nr:glutaminase [Egibacter rhizosphaerae]QBI19473.1 glutaminase [Egibacter rhizosphaerae]